MKDLAIVQDIVGKFAPPNTGRHVVDFSGHSDFPCDRIRGGGIRGATTGFHHICRVVPSKMLRAAKRFAVWASGGSRVFQSK